MEFVDLNTQPNKQSLDIVFRKDSFDQIDTFDLNKPKFKKNIIIPKGETTSTLTETFNVNPEVEQDNDPNSICVKECSVGSNVICPDKSGFFKVDNLLGELKTEYDKAMARKNLGIATKDLLYWGNILGNLVNQPDLVNFVAEQIEKGNQEVLNIVQKQIDELNAQSSITTLYYGDNLDNMNLSNYTTFTTGDYDGFIYVASPKYPTKFIVNGLEGGFDYQNSLNLNNETFYLYKSTYSNLGETEITVTYG